jgi:hypothetical protein
MTDIIISDKKEEKPAIQDNDIKQTLERADNYRKLKEENDKMEAEYNRREELLKGKIAVGGRALAGQYIPEKSPEEIAKEEAAKILSMFR